MQVRTKYQLGMTRLGIVGSGLEKGTPISMKLRNLWGSVQILIREWGALHSLAPSEHQKDGCETDYYLYPFSGKKTISYPLNGVGSNLRKLQVVLGMGSNFEIIIYDIKISS